MIRTRKRWGEPGAIFSQTNNDHRREKQEERPGSEKSEGRHHKKQPEHRGERPAKGEGCGRSLFYRFRPTKPTKA